MATARQKKTVKKKAGHKKAKARMTKTSRAALIRRMRAARARKKSQSVDKDLPYLETLHEAAQMAVDYDRKRGHSARQAFLWNALVLHAQASEAYKSDPHGAIACEDLTILTRGFDERAAFEHLVAEIILSHRNHVDLPRFFAALSAELTNSSTANLGALRLDASKVAEPGSGPKVVH